MSQLSPNKGTASNVADIVETANNEFKKAMGRAEQVALDVAEHGGRQAQQVLQDFEVGMRRSIRDRPMMTMIGAALVGFVVGVLWRSE